MTDEEFLAKAASLKEDVNVVNSGEEFEILIERLTSTEFLIRVCYEGKEFILVEESAYKRFKSLIQAE